MIHVEVQEHVNKPPAEVFEYLANFENNPRWQKGMRSARFTTAGPLRLGSSYDQVASFLGREIRTSFEVVDYEPSERITIQSTTGPFPIRVTRSTAPEGEGTNVRAEVSGDATGFFRLWKPLLAAMVKRQVRADYRRLRQVLEGSP